MGSCFQVRSSNAPAQKPAKVNKQPLEENAACGQIAVIADKAASGEKPK